MFTFPCQSSKGGGCSFCWSLWQPDRTSESKSHQRASPATPCRVFNSQTRSIRQPFHHPGAVLVSMEVSAWGFLLSYVVLLPWPLHFWGQVLSYYLTSLKDLRRVSSVQLTQFWFVVRVKWQLPSSLCARSEAESPNPGVELVSVFSPCAPPVPLLTPSCTSFSTGRFLSPKPGLWSIYLVSSE